MLPEQYLIPFAPSPAWWIARDNALAMRVAINHALAVASLDAASVWCAEPTSIAQRDDREAPPEQLRLIFPDTRHGARVGDRHF